MDPTIKHVIVGGEPCPQLLHPLARGAGADPEAGRDLVVGMVVHEALLEQGARLARGAVEQRLDGDQRLPVGKLVVRVGAGDGEADLGLPAGDEEGDTAVAVGGWSWIPRF